MKERLAIEKVESVDAHVAQTISDEVLRDRIRKLISEPKPESWLKRISKNPLSLLIVGFILTTLGGAILTNYYNSRQAEVQRQRSFVDELNKIRLNKMGDVWEKVYLYEASVNDVMQQFEVSMRESNVQLRIPPGNDVLKHHEKSESLHDELVDVLNKNRFWIADENYQDIQGYANATYDYYLAKKSGKITKEQEAKRVQARDNLIKVRERMLKE